MKIFTRNIKGKLIALAIGIVFFGGLQIFSMTIAKDDYVFGWLGENKYSYVWISAAVMIVFDQTIMSYILMLGTILGALIGKFLGDFLEAQTLAKITPDMDHGQAAMIIGHAHKGIFMYWFTVLVSLALGIVVALFQHQRKRELAKAQENNQN